jgi:hypothetical protein
LSRHFKCTSAGKFSYGFTTRKGGQKTRQSNFRFFPVKFFGIKYAKSDKFSCLWVIKRWYQGDEMLYLLTAIGLSPDGSTHLHTNNTQKPKKQPNNTNTRVRAVPCLCKFYPGICLTTDEKARKTLSQGKKNLSQVTKNLSQSAVCILPKTPTHYKTLTNTVLYIWLYTKSKHGVTHLDGKGRHNTNVLLGMSGSYQEP